MRDTTKLQVRTGQRDDLYDRTSEATETPEPANASGRRAAFWRPFGDVAEDVVCGECSVDEPSGSFGPYADEVLPVATANDARSHGMGGVVIVAVRLLATARSTRHTWNTRALVVGGKFIARYALRPAVDAMLAQNAPGSRRAIIHAPTAEAFHALFELLIPTGRGGQKEAWRVHGVIDLLSRCLAPVERTASGLIGISAVREHLAHHVAEPVTLDELSAVAAISKFHLLRRFQRQTGMSPRTFQLQLRLASALAMILAGSPLIRSTFDAGFADQSHLTRRLKRYAGLSPGAFREAMRSPTTDARRSVVSAPDDLGGRVA